jgi:hypothetical protein
MRLDEIRNPCGFDLGSKLGVRDVVSWGVIMIVLRRLAMIHVQDPSVNPKMDYSDVLCLFTVEVEMMIAEFNPAKFPFKC